MTTLNSTQNRFARCLVLGLSSSLVAASCWQLSAQDNVPVTDGSVMMVAPAPAANFVPGRMIGMRPEEKRPLVLKQNERNPYAKRGAEEEPTGEDGVNAEEQQIRARLGSLSVSGRSQGPNGLRILLGDIILEQGRLLPQLLEEQSENLKVLEINEDTLILGWLDLETGEPTGKIMQVAYDLTPMVTYALQGQEASVDEGDSGEVAGRRMGVMRIGHDRQKLESRMAASRKGPKPPREAIEAGQ